MARAHTDYGLHDLRLTLTAEEATAIMGDFIQSREPSPAGKVLYAQLAQIATTAREARDD